MNSAILLVDVGSASRDSWKSFLQSHDYDVFTAEDRESALRECLELQPDLILLHDTLPDADGFELCHRMKGNPLNQQIPIVLIKPSSDPADLARARKAGAAEFWGTSTSLGDALSRVESLLRLRGYIDEQARSVVLSLARSIEAKSPLMNGHSDRIVKYALQLGSGMDLPEEDLHELRIACLLHDIGKVSVPDEILLKPGPLNAEETAIIRQHPIIGETICAPLRSIYGTTMNEWTGAATRTASGEMKFHCWREFYKLRTSTTRSSRIVLTGKRFLQSMPLKLSAMRLAMVGSTLPWCGNFRASAEKVIASP